MTYCVSPAAGAQNVTAGVSIDLGRYKLHLGESDMFKQLQSKVGVIWCTLAHDSVTWPVHGHYECRTCGRLYAAFPETPVSEVKETGSTAVSLLHGRLPRTAWLSRA